MNTKWHKASMGIAVLLALVLMVSVLPTKAAYAQEPPPWEQEPWNDVLQSFQKLAQQSAYKELDKEFENIAGFKAIEKTQKILSVIEKLDKIKTYYEKVIAAEPSQQAGIDFLEGVAVGLNALADVPVPLVGQFLKFYAWGINECVTMLREIDERLRETCIRLVNAGDVDFAVYISQEAVVQELLKKKQQDELAKRASRAVAEKKRRLERKKAQILAFCLIGDPLVDAEKGFTRFVQQVVERVEGCVGREGNYTWQFDSMLRRLKRYSREGCDELFKLTEPRDKLEEQYTGWVDGLIAAAKTTVEATQAHLPILREASGSCRSAERALNYVQYVVDDIGDAVEQQTFSGLRSNIAQLRSQIEGLKGGIPAGEQVTTREEALQRLTDISTTYNRVAQATPLSTEASDILQQANDFKQAMLTKLAELQATLPAAGTPYNYISSLYPYGTTLSVDDVTEAIRGFPRSVEPHFHSRTVVAHVVEREEEDEYTGELVMKTYYQFEEAGPHTTFDVSVEPAGIVSASLEEIRGLSAGRATVTVSTPGYTIATILLGHLYTPSQYSSKQIDTIDREVSCYVHEFAGITLDPSQVDLFVPASEWDSAEDEQLVGVDYNFIDYRTSAYDVNPSEGSLTVNSSNELAVSVEDARIKKPHYGFGSFHLVGWEPGESTVTFNIVNDAGETLASEGLRATSNKVRVFADTYSLEGVPLETTSEGHPLHRTHAWVHAGQVMELRVEVEGPVNMSGYECLWDKLGGLKGIYPELDSAVTAFVGNTSTNYLRVPADVKPGSIYSLEVSIRPSGAYNNVFEGVVPVIQVRPARLNQVSLFVGFASGEWPHLLNELHLFTSRTGYRAEVEIFPAGYFTDEPNDTITKDVYRTMEYIDTVGNFHRYTDLMYVPGVLWATQKVDSATQDFFHFIKPLNPGITALFSVSWAYSYKLYVDNDKGYVRSANAMQVYTDPMSLEGPYDRKVASGETLRLKLNVETEGDLTDYECVWSLSTDVGVLESEVTEFIKGENENWYSENQWAVPADQEGQEVHMEAVIRLKGSEKALGKDATIATIVSPLPGDVNSDGDVSLADAILALKVLCGLDTTGESLRVSADVNGDGKIGLEEVVYILKKVSR